MLPGTALAADWTEGGRADIGGLSRLEAADQQEEAVAIALILRHAIETTRARAALVTPDRALAARVAAELGRWEIVADDSAGEPLAETPPAVFLRLLVRAVSEELAPVALLALLKHPLAAAGLDPLGLSHRRTGAGIDLPPWPAPRHAAGAAPPRSRGQARVARPARGD